MVSSENSSVKSLKITPLDDEGNVKGETIELPMELEGRIINPNWVEPEEQERLFLAKYEPIEWSWTLDMKDWNNRRLFNILTGNQETKIWKQIGRRRNARRRK